MVIHEIRFSLPCHLEAHEVDRPIWDYLLKLYVPETLQSQIALFFIKGGHNDQEVPRETEEKLLQESSQNGFLILELFYVPNQPLQFGKEKLIEDEIIAYGLKKFTETGDKKWWLRGACIEAAQRALDLATQFLQSRGHKLEGVILCGESKRALVAWHLAALDKRVQGLIAISCDFLNLKELLPHQLKSYGSYPSKLSSYLLALQSGSLEAVLQLEDPYYKLDQINIPKLLINPSNDAYTIVDASQFYLDKLQGVTYLQYVPNAGHSGHDALDQVCTFYHGLTHGHEIPELLWEWDEDELTYSFSEKPESLTLWTAYNPDARDFREVLWEPLPLINCSATLSMGIPETGWKAYFIEAVFELEGRSFTLTTDVRVFCSSKFN